MSPKILERPRLPIENTGEQHLACAVVVDTSGSMRGYETQLVEAITQMKEAIENDDVARGRVEVCLITYDDDVREESPFGPITKMTIPNISCDGMTSTHAAIDFALRRVAERKAEYQQNHVTYNQPWIWLLTDGEPNDFDNGSFGELLQAQRDNKCVFFGVAVGDDANEHQLAGMHKNNIVLKVGKDNFASVFEFISQSVSGASVNKPGTSISVVAPEDIRILTIPT